MNVRRGRDGKQYPVSRDRGELVRLVGLEHRLACTEGLSRRQMQSRLLMRHGVRRSIGAISQDLARYECDACQVQPAPARVEPAVVAWR